MYVIFDVDRAGKALLTLIIDNLDQHLAELGQRGFVPEKIGDEPGRYRKAIFRDPDGNTIGFDQVSTGES